MPVQKSVKSLESLCVTTVVDNLDASAKWARHFVKDQADPKNGQLFLTPFDLIRKNKMYYFLQGEFNS